MTISLNVVFNKVINTLLSLGNWDWNRWLNTLQGIDKHCWLYWTSGVLFLSVELLHPLSKQNLCFQNVCIIFITSDSSLLDHAASYTNKDSMLLTNFYISVFKAQYPFIIYFSSAWTCCPLKQQRFWIAA